MQRFHYDQIDSTNAEARRLAATHPDERFLVTAARQSAGRGRLGRNWQSPLGGAWMSIVWPTGSSARTYAPVALVAAVASRRALKELTAGAGTEISVKWPNDLLIAERKVAGILCELFSSAGRPGGTSTVVIGIGVNVSFDLALLAGELHHRVTTLRAASGRTFEVDAVIASVSRHVSEAVETFEREGLSAELLAELEASLAYVGTVREWSSPQGRIQGRILGIDSAGRLRLESDGRVIACDVGELVTSQT